MGKWRRICYSLVRWDICNRTSLFNNKVININDVTFVDCCKSNDLISLITCTIDKLNNNSWAIIGNKITEIPFSLFPNEQFRNKGWVGAKTYGSAIVEIFLDAFYGLVPWDDFADPFYLDKLLFEPSKKPAGLIYLKK
jgi:hypothetical protein